MLRSLIDVTLADEDGYSKVFDIITDFESDAEKRAYKRQLEIVLSILGIMLFRACLVVVLTKELNSGARYAFSTAYFHLFSFLISPGRTCFAK